MNEQNEIVLYQPNELTKLEVHINQETVWLTQQQIAELFGVKQPAISKHLNNIFKEGELDKNSVHSILEYTASDGKTYKTVSLRAAAQQSAKNPPRHRMGIPRILLASSE